MIRDFGGKGPESLQIQDAIFEKVGGRGGTGLTKVSLLKIGSLGRVASRGERAGKPNVGLGGCLSSRLSG